MKIEVKSDGISAVLNTEQGAIESILDDQSREHYWEYDSAVWPRRTAVCFPICGTLIDGKYRVGEKEYELPNHGFLREKDLKVECQTRDRLVLSLEQSEQTKKVYPYDFRFELEYRAEGNRLIATYRVTNPAREDLLFSVGAHYTYALPAPQAECFYMFDRPQTLGAFGAVEGGVSLEKKPLLENEDRLSMNELFENGAKMLDMRDVTSTTIGIGTAGKLFTSVESIGFPYVILWAPGGNRSPFACIEPWAGLADLKGHDQVFAHKKGIQGAKPGQTREFIQIITVH